MPDVAYTYLHSQHDTFWQWKDSGEVVAWADGRTIAFREELTAVLQHLAPQGLPPFGAVLLLLGATRDNWGASPAGPGILAGILREPTDSDSKNSLLSSILGRLDRIRYLEPGQRNSIVAKQTLADLVFSGVKGRTSRELAQAVVRLLEEGLGEEPLVSITGRRQPDSAPSELVRDLHCLSGGLDRVDPKSLRLRLQTGLDDLPQPADIDLTPAQRVRALLAELADDEEHRAMASLAKNIMAAVTLPRSVSDHEELPIGGVSDITNRGQLDRLLLSELVHDDLTLAIRVAVNEAMYLRRESPPRTPTRQRAVLLEAGIRSWGIPRFYATAVALALIATSDPDSQIVTYCAQGESIVPIDLTTRVGLVEHLATLEPELHPGNALGAFLASVSNSEEAAEPVLVITEDAFESPEFQKTVASQDIELLHVATVNRDGQFRLIERTSRGQKMVREAQLSLDELLTTPKRQGLALLDRTWATDLPAILSVAPFPLLLSREVDSSRMCEVEGCGVLAFHKDRRLLHWTQARRGARQIADNIPRGALLWSSRTPVDGIVRAVVGHLDPKGLHLLEIDLDHMRCDSQRLEVDRGVRSVCSHNGVLFAVFKDRVQVINLVSGDVMQTLVLPTGMLWARARFFRGNSFNCWHALSYDGRTARLEQVSDESAVKRPLLTLFERDGIDGPIGVTVQGDLYMTATHTICKPHFGPSNNSIEVVAITADGRRVAMRQAANVESSFPQTFIVDVDTLTVDRRHIANGGSIESFSNVVRPVSLRNRFVDIGIDQAGVLTLTSRKQVRLAIDYDSTQRQIRLRPNQLPQEHTKRSTFKQVDMPSEVGFQLTVATWGDGSQAFLDSRGLLHLKSSDVSIPEVSIVLNDGVLSGWCSDGRLWGQSYFLGDEESAPTRAVFDETIKAFTERLR